MMKLQKISQFPDPRWDAFVRSQKLSSIYHFSGWNAVARRAYDTDSILLYVEADDGAILAGTPLFFPKRVGSAYATTGVFGAYGPILSVDPEAFKLVAQAVREEVAARRASYLLWKAQSGGAPSAHDELVAQGYKHRELWITALLKLEESEDKQFQTIGSSMRAKVRKAQKSGLEIRWDKSPEALGAFYETLSKNMQRKGAPIYGREFFAQMLENFQGETDILTLWLDGRAVSGAMVQTHFALGRGTVTVPFVSSLPEVFNLRPNNLLYWEIIRRSIEKRAHTLDFGTSLAGASTIEFKKSWGSEVVPLPSYFYTPPTRPEFVFDPQAKGIKLGSKLLEYLPRPIFEKVGPWICGQMI